MKQIQENIMNEVSRQMSIVGVDRTALAESMGVTTGFISHLFKGRRKLTLLHMAQFEQALKCQFQITVQPQQPNEVKP